MFSVIGTITIPFFIVAGKPINSVLVEIFPVFTKRTLLSFFSYAFLHAVRTVTADTDPVCGNIQSPLQESHSVSDLP